MSVNEAVSLAVEPSPAQAKVRKVTKVTTVSILSPFRPTRQAPILLSRSVSMDHTHRIPPDCFQTGRVVSMETTASPPTPEQAWEAFKQGVTSLFKQWTVLQLAVENGWGDGDSRRKAEIMLEETLAMFEKALKKQKAVYRDEVEDALAIFLDEQFETVAEDGSLQEVGEVIMTMWSQCGSGNLAMVQAVLAKEQAVSQAQRHYREMAKAASGGAGSDDSDDDDIEDEDAAATADRPTPRGSRSGGAASSSSAAGSGDGMEVDGEGGGGRGGGGKAALVDEDGWQTVPARRRSSRLVGKTN